MTGGMAYEALNNLGHSDRNVIIVLNDNGRSYAPTVSKLSDSLTSIRLNPVYMRRQRRLETFLRDLPLVGSPGREGRRGLQGRGPGVLPAAGVLRDARRPLRRPGRRARHRGARGARCATPPSSTGRSSSTPSPRRAAATRRPRTTTRSTSTTPRCSILAVGPPKAVPTGYTQAFAEAVHQGGRARGRARGHHRGHARADRPDPVPGPLPRPLLRRRHRRAARRHRGRRHGDGRAAARRRHLLHVPQPGLGPGRLRRRAAPPAGAVLRSTAPASRATTAPATTASTTWRCSRRVPGMTVLAPSSAQELQQMLHDAIGLLDAGPVAIRYPKGQARQVPDDRGRLGARGAAGAGRATAASASSPSASSSANAERAAQLLADDGHRRDGLGRALLCAARPDDDRRRRPPPSWSSPARTASATAASA